MSRFFSFTNGFTLVELLLVIALGALLAGATYVVNIQSIRIHEFQRARETTYRELWHARADTISHTQDSAWGVHVAGQTMTRYRGNSYLDRQTEDDVVHIFPEYITFSTTDVSFQRPEGTLVSQRVITLSGQNQNTIITVSTAGVVTMNP